MIALLRIDDRMLHGQVASYWVNHLNTDMITIVSDRYANNSLLRSSLRLGKPSGVKMNILTVEDAVGYLNDNISNSLRVFAITETIEDALFILNNIDEKIEVNVGGVPNKEESIRIGSQVFLTREEMSKIEEIAGLGHSVNVQAIPAQPPMSIEELRRRFK